MPTPAETAKKLLQALQNQLLVESRPLEIVRIQADIESLKEKLAFLGYDPDDPTQAKSPALASPPQAHTLLSVKTAPLERCDVLVLAAQPIGMEKLDLAGEAELIREELSRGASPMKVGVVESAVVDDLTRYLIEAQPKFLHFAGHGGLGGSLLWPTRAGLVATLTPEALAESVRLAGPPLRCVVLNACQSLEQAAAFARFCQAVIVTNRGIPDSAARSFSQGFYRAISDGRSIFDAYRFGNNQVALSDREYVEAFEFMQGDIEGSGRPTQRGKPPSSQPVCTPDTSQPKHDVPGHDCLVWFGTDRAWVDPAQPAKGFSGERGGALTVGQVKVFVPSERELGSLGSPWWQRLFKKDDRLKVDWATLRSWAETAYWGEFRQALASWQAEHPDRQADILVYIHGYNVSFEAAALRAAQLGHDLAIPGLTAFYSWPSKAKTLLYMNDAASVQASETHLARFLRHLLDESGGARVNILAHSMGNRALLGTVQSLRGQLGRRFGHIILCAPDVDRDVFKNLALAYPEVADHTTLYISDKDRAVGASEFLHGAPRAGLFEPVTVVPGVETVSAGEVSLDPLGHGFYAARNVMSDIFALLTTGHTAASGQRFALRPATSADGSSFWTIKA